MTIRRHFDFSQHNDSFMHFEQAVEAAPEGHYNLGRRIKSEIGEACDDLITALRRIGAPVNNCDSIREIEILMFERVRSDNRGFSAGTEIEELIQIGRRMNWNDWSFDDAYMDATQRDAKALYRNAAAV